MRRCLLLHQAVPEEAGPDEQDTRIAAAAIAEALEAGGWEVERLAVGLDLSAAAARLREDPPALVFNLVESLPGVAFPGPAGLAAAAMLEGTGVPFTGSGLAALALSTDKPAAKRVLRAAGVPVPAGPEEGWPGPFIVKHAREHASFGLGRHSVVSALPEALAAGWFAEAFLPGREFNVSLLAEADGIRVLPPAELLYDAAWPPAGGSEGMPRILDYAGKWRPDDPLFAATRRSFEGIEDELLALLEEMARRANAALGLAGYGRVDFRLDARGVPHVLEVNANPALAPDAGFAAAAQEAGIGYRELIGRIAEAATGPCGAEAAKRGERAGAKVPEVTLRRTLLAEDAGAIGGLCRASGFFSEEEVGVAEELVRAALAGGEASGYRFLLAEQPHGLLLGYACFGPVPASAGAWDLYWIVVHPAAQGAGLGRQLIAAAAAEAAGAGARILYAETAGRALYAPTRRFYAGAGFTLEAVLPDFYAPGDAKQIWALKLRAVRQQGARRGVDGAEPSG
ncbi:MAG: GNAT family N-acetyltransferase [Rhodospirillales bacterium]|nr:GNAT family N-acetyltransferase [Rhodospirillales bacterium]